MPSQFQPAVEPVRFVPVIRFTRAIHEPLSAASGSRATLPHPEVPFNALPYSTVRAGRPGPWNFNLLSVLLSAQLLRMGLPTEPVTLTPSQIAEFSKQLSTMRHDVNNNLALVVAALELLRRRPDMAPKLIESLSAQPDKITGQMQTFSNHFDALLGITRERVESGVQA